MAKSKEQVEGQKELIRALVFCVLAIVVIRSFLFEPFKIPSSSMLPTLTIGDHIFVSKYNYGLSIPFTKVEIVRWGEPKRGDVIVFLYPKDESLHYIKRVIGLPGDEIELKGMDIFVNGKKLKRTLIKNTKALDDAIGTDALVGKLFEESIDGTKHYVQYSKGGNAPLGRLNVKLIVPENSYWVMGDNRDDSYDSRAWGALKREYIKGKAQIIWLSLDQGESWGDLHKVRWDRFGTVIR